MEFIIGLLLICTFFALAYYCVKGYNLMIGFLVVTIIWTILSLVGAGFSSPEFIAENPVLQFGDDFMSGLVGILNIIRTLRRAGEPLLLMYAGVHGSAVSLWIRESHLP